MAKIKLLPREIYSKIAAGEVIDGPHSVVRELIDNSIDALSTSLKIEIKSGGKLLILVQDDGEGMSWDDAELAVKRHATSKISRIEDLGNINTMGFRGEALSSISSVSDFELITKNKESVYGIRLVCEYGEVTKMEPVPFMRGTKITVRNLFENMPARKKFLKSNRSESIKVKDVILKKALCFNEVAFRYKTEDKIIFSLPEKQSRLERIISLFGREIEGHLIELEYQNNNFSIRGFITDKSYTISNRNGQYLFINQRPIHNRSLQFVINEAAKRFITQGRYIYAFIYVDINPGLIDINVHPAKLEVKIKIEKEVSSALYRIIQNSYQNKIFNIKDYNVNQIIDDVNPNLNFKAGKHREEYYKEGQSNLYDYIGNDAFNIVKDEETTEYGKLEKNKIESVELVGEEVSIEDLSFHSLKFNYVGSIFYGFLIFDVGDSIFLIDQHAAHERILYEEYAKKYSMINPVKNLLIPINLAPPPGKYDEIMENIDDFNTAGIKIEPFGDGSFNIVSIPAFLPEDKETKIILEFFNEYFMTNAFPESGPIKDRFLKYAACKAAIKEGDRITRTEAYQLLEKLLKCDVPYICPHGRPTILKISRNYIEKIFKRR